jgi:hypothetical protein
MVLYIFLPYICFHIISVFKIKRNSPLFCVKVAVIVVQVMIALILSTQAIPIHTLVATWMNI